MKSGTQFLGVLAFFRDFITKKKIIKGSLLYNSKYKYYDRVMLYFIPQLHYADVAWASSV
jgi:hypothetical protein